MMTMMTTTTTMMMMMTSGDIHMVSHWFVKDGLYHHHHHHHPHHHHHHPRRRRGECSRNRRSGKGKTERDQCMAPIIPKIVDALNHCHYNQMRGLNSVHELEHMRNSLTTISHRCMAVPPLALPLVSLHTVSNLWRKAHPNLESPFGMTPLGPKHP